MPIRPISNMEPMANIRAEVLNPLIAKFNSEEIDQNTAESSIASLRSQITALSSGSKGLAYFISQNNNVTQPMTLNVSTTIKTDMNSTFNYFSSNIQNYGMDAGGGGHYLNSAGTYVLEFTGVLSAATTLVLSLQTPQGSPTSTVLQTAPVVAGGYFIFRQLVTIPSGICYFNITSGIANTLRNASIKLTSV